MNLLDKFVNTHIQRSRRIYDLALTWFKEFDDLVVVNGINYGTALFVPIFMQIVVGESNEEE